MVRKPGTKRKATEDRLWTLLDKIRAEGRATGPSDFAKEAGIDRSYLYTFRELAAEVSEYGLKTQPRKSRRGAAVSKAEAKRRGIEDQVRREHTRWAKVVPELKRRLEEAVSTVKDLEGQVARLRAREKRLMRACELLLMLASEAGANPNELEEVRRKALQEPA